MPTLSGPERRMSERIPTSIGVHVYAYGMLVGIGTTVGGAPWRWKHCRQLPRPGGHGQSGLTPTTESARCVAPGMHQSKRHREGGVCVWWSRRESNPRPKVLYSKFYILSPFIWF